MTTSTRLVDSPGRSPWGGGARESVPASRERAAPLPPRGGASSGTRGGPSSSSSAYLASLGGPGGPQR
eukprot:680643-Pyramimonas_sp.AAC.1